MWVVIQEGGSSVELYAHSFDTLQDAEAFRYSCAEGAYQTTDPIAVPDETDMEALADLLGSLPTLTILDREDDEGDAETT